MINSTIAQKTLSTIDKEFLDAKVKPSEDFFLFSNGKWIAKSKIPASESRWGSFNELEQNNKKKLTQILDFATKNPGKKGSQNQLLGDYYLSYTNMNIRNKSGFQSVKVDLDEINALKSVEELPAMVAKLHLDGLGTLFSFGVDQDLKNIDRNVVYLSQGGIGLPNCEYYLKENKKTILDAYKLYVEKSFVKFGLKRI